MFEAKAGSMHHASCTRTFAKEAPRIMSSKRQLMPTPARIRG